MAAGHAKRTIFTITRKRTTALAVGDTKPLRCHLCCQTPVDDVRNNLESVNFIQSETWLREPSLVIAFDYTPDILARRTLQLCCYRRIGAPPTGDYMLSHLLVAGKQGSPETLPLTDKSNTALGFPTILPLVSCGRNFAKVRYSLHVLFYWGAGISHLCSSVTKFSVIATSLSPVRRFSRGHRDAGVTCHQHFQ